MEFYESEAFENAMSISTTVDVESPDAVTAAARAISDWAVRMLRVKDDLLPEKVASLQALLGLNFWVRGLIEALDEALWTDDALFDAASR